MIFFDEFPLRSLLRPDGTVNAALFPNFAWLSKNTNWMRNATGVSGFTPYAVPAMLRGKFPAKALPPVYDSYKDNLLAELYRHVQRVGDGDHHGAVPEHAVQDLNQGAPDDRARADPVRTARKS